MTRNRIKIHPFGYKKLKPSHKRFGTQTHMVQTINLTIPYDVLTRDKEGKVVGVNTFCNHIVKNIYHDITNKPRKGRTLGEMVYATADV